MSPNEKKTVLALGFFDGVHLGHAALLRRTAERARELSAEAAVMTFDTHPDTLVRGEAVPLITSAPDRAALIREGFGIDRVEFFRFTEETMRIPWQDFLGMISEKLQTVHFVVGYDFRFGWRGEGSAEKLRDYCREHGLGCDVIGKVTHSGITVSSTAIREMLKRGDMRTAAEFMGHPHILTDTVRHGQRLGRQLGRPTVNMQFAPGVLVPRLGVYAAHIHTEDGVFPAVTNIGVRPTVSQSGEITVESHILDYSGNLYGKTVRLDFLDFLRDEKRFSSPGELAEQIAQDTLTVRKRWEEGQ